jgi:Protein of unknown function (DUF2582).
MIELIGTNAGAVWAILSEKGESGFKALKKATKLKDKEVWAALGWLAREGKLVVAEKEDDVYVSLVG